MPRQIAVGRQIAIGRKLATGRIPVPTAPNDGKPSAVLDTTTIHAALMQKKNNKIGASSLVIEALKNNKFHIFYTDEVLHEYEHELYNNAAPKQQINSSDIAPLLDYIKSKNNAVRMSVDKTVEGTDGHVFDAALNSNSLFIVTLDNKGAFKKYKHLEKLGSLKIFSPEEFLHKILKLK